MSCLQSFIPVCEMAMALFAEHGGQHDNRLEEIFRLVWLNPIFEGAKQINLFSLIEDQQAPLPDFNHSQSGTATTPS